MAIIPKTFLFCLSKKVSLMLKSLLRNRSYFPPKYVPILGSKTFDVQKKTDLSSEVASHPKFTDVESLISTYQTLQDVPNPYQVFANFHIAVSVLSTEYGGAAYRISPPRAIPYRDLGQFRGHGGRPHIGDPARSCARLLCLGQ